MDPSPQQTPLNKPGKVSINPFAHFIRGNKNLFSTNASSAILSSVTTVVIGFGLGLLFTLIILDSLKNLVTGFSASSLASVFVGLIIKMLIFWLISSLVVGYFYELVIRAILTGTRREHVSFGSLFTFVAKRYLLAVLTALILGGVFIVGLVIIIGAGMIQPVLALLAGVIVGIFLLLFSFRMSYVFYVVVDDEQPQSARWILKRSTALWKKSGGALVTYYVVIIAISLVIGVLFGPHNSTTTSTTLQPTSSLNVHPAIAYGSLIIISLLEGIFILLLSAAIGDIYNSAKLAVDGNNQPTQPVNQVVPPPVNPYLAAGPSVIQPHPVSNNPPPSSLPNPETIYPQQSAQEQVHPAPESFQAPSPQIVPQNPTVVTPEHSGNNYEPPQQPPTPIVG